jgi:hypothetical protein
MIFQVIDEPHLSESLHSIFSATIDWQCLSVYHQIDYSRHLSLSQYALGACESCKDSVIGSSILRHLGSSMAY